MTTKSKIDAIEAEWLAAGDYITRRDKMVLKIMRARQSADLDVARNIERHWHDVAWAASH